jgi:group I intron endonuclease
MEGYFYITKNLINGKFYYGSSTVGKKNYFGSNVNLDKARKKYGDENFEHIPLKYFKTRQEAFEFEDRFLKLYKISKIPDSYNMKDSGRGGWTTKNYTPEQLEEYKNKLSSSQKGRIVSLETREKISQSNKGKFSGNLLKMKESIKKLWKDPNSIYNSDEYRNKLSESQKGRIFSDETKNKISKANSGGKNGMSIKIEIDGKIFETRRSAAIEYNISDTAVSKRCKSKNFPNWKFI